MKHKLTVTDLVLLSVNFPLPIWKLQNFLPILVYPQDRAIWEYALFCAVWEEVLHCLVRKGDLMRTIRIVLFNLIAENRIDEECMTTFFSVCNSVVDVPHYCPEVHQLLCEKAVCAMAPTLVNSFTVIHFTYKCNVPCHSGSCTLTSQISLPCHHQRDSA